MIAEMTATKAKLYAVNLLFTILINKNHLIKRLLLNLARIGRRECTESEFKCANGNCIRVSNLAYKK